MSDDYLEYSLEFYNLLSSFVLCGASRELYSNYFIVPKFGESTLLPWWLFFHVRSLGFLPGWGGQVAWTVSVFNEVYETGVSALEPLPLGLSLLLDVAVIASEVL